MHNIANWLYKVRLVGRNYNKQKGTSYDVYGITIPYPEFIGKKCRIEKIDENNIHISVVSEEMLQEIENEKQKAALQAKKKKRFADMHRQGLITKEQFDQYVQDGIEPQPKALVAKEG